MQSRIEEQEFLFRPKLAVNDQLLTNSLTTLILLQEIYQKLKEVAIEEFSYIKQVIVEQWHQLLAEKPKKDFNRTFAQLQNLAHDILVFMRCELTSRVFIHMRDMPVILLIL